MALTLHFMGGTAVFAVIMVLAIVPVFAIMRARKLDVKYKPPSSFKGKAGSSSGTLGTAVPTALASTNIDAELSSPTKGPTKQSKQSLE